MSSPQQRLEAIPDVEIDDDGVFKYVLIEVADAKDESVKKFVVRGNAESEYHADIYEPFCRKTEGPLSMDCQCRGGGRIKHDAADKKILVYGYSMGYGRADHTKAVELLKRRYPDYSSITFSNDGY